MKIFKINKREKIISILCPVFGGIEWIIINKIEDNEEIIDRGYEELNLDHEGLLPLNKIPKKIIDKLRGDVYISIPLNKTLSIITSLPSDEPDNIYQISKIQIDKISPYSSEKLIYSYEITNFDDKSSDVIMMGVNNNIIPLAESYSTKNLNLASIDCRIFSWLELLINNNKNLLTKNNIIILDDSIDFTILIINNDKIKLIRSLYLDHDNSDFISELIYEINYSLKSINIKMDIFNNISIWNYLEWNNKIINKLADSLSININQNNLSNLGKISEGMVKRINKKNIINFLPVHIYNKQSQHQIFKKLKFLIILSTFVIALILMIFQVNYGIQTNKLKKVKNYYSEILPQANIAKENNKKLRALKNYTDRSKSPLECLREITILLPAGDIEIASFNFSNNNITIRGTAIDDDIVYDFFNNLGKSDLFDGLKNQSVNNRAINGKKRTVFSISINVEEKEL